MICFKERLKQLRKDKCLTQQELAELMSVSKSTISGYETGAYQPSLENLIRIANIFDVSADYFYANLKQTLSEYKTDIRVPVISKIPDNISLSDELADICDTSPIKVLYFRSIPPEYKQNYLQYFIFEKNTVQYIIRIGENCSNGDTVLACVNGGDADMYLCIKRDCDNVLIDSQNNKYTSSLHIIGVAVEIRGNQQ